MSKRPTLTPDVTGRHEVCRPRAGEDVWHTVLLLVRLRRGVVGEARRVVHLVPVPTDHVPAALTAFCGAEIVPGTAEVLSCFTGVPCTPCLAAAPLPEADR